MSNGIKDLNIVMMGASGTGKTCYMLAMYAAMSASVRGFSFSSQNLDDDLELTDRWEEMLEGAWPAPTSQTTPFAFDCNYGFKPIMGFKWLDYRGGVLREKEVDSADVAEFRARLKEASCIILCVAGDQLAKYVDTNALPRGVREFNSQIAAAHKENKVTIPVVIAITKADQCPSDKMDEGIEKMRTNLLSSLFVSGGDWLVMFCPVSMGVDLEKPQGADALGKIAPLNVHLPVTFAIYTQLEKEIREKEEKIRTLKGRAEDSEQIVAQMEQSFWGPIFRRGSIRSTQESIDAIRKDTALTEKEAQNFRDNLRRIQQDLMGGGNRIFFNGRRVDISL